MTSPATAAALPVGHPATTLGPDGTYRYLDLTVAGGWSSPQTPALSHWHAGFVAYRSGSDAGDPVPVAQMELTVVHAAAGDPVTELGLVNEDAAELGAALWRGSRRDPVFATLAPDDGGRVLLVDTFEVDPAWRGTALTPILALRALRAFAHLGVETAALCAAPLAEDMDPVERSRIGDKIARMWARVGFTTLPTANLDGLDNRVMASIYDTADLVARSRDLAGHEAALLAAADLG